MRLLVDILHPKQAHFFRPLIRRWQAQGHAVQIVTRDKDITHQLLDGFGLPYLCLSRQRRGAGMARELVERWLRMAGVIRRFRPDITLSVTGISTALPSRLLGIPTIALTDTETATLSNRIAFPFADRILTPQWYQLDHGARHHRYRGFHEWSYLHPDEFSPEPALVRAQGIEPTEPYAVVRFVRWDAAHDQGELGLRPADAVAMVEGLAQQMRVVLSSEAPPPPALRPYVAPLQVEQMHHIMAFARLVAGESPSMATEAALLGVPAVLVSSWAGRCGNMQVLEQRYGLMRLFERGQEAVEATLQLAADLPARSALVAQRGALFSELEPIPQMLDRHIQALTGG